MKKTRTLRKYNPPIEVIEEIAQRFNVKFNSVRAVCSGNIRSARIEEALAPYMCKFPISEESLRRCEEIVKAHEHGEKRGPKPKKNKTQE